MQLKKTSALPQSSTAPNVVGATSQRTYLTMMANNHVVNFDFVAALFRDGAVKRICNEVRSAARHDNVVTERPLDQSEQFRRGVRVVFLGDISAAIKETILKHDSIRAFPEYDCVDLLGPVSDSFFKDEIVPKTRAVLNPFLGKVQSGISVKSLKPSLTPCP
jgi:hypothetical protein